MEFDFDPVKPTRAPVMIEVEGKSYRLQDVRSGGCDGCAFKNDLCAEIPGTGSCLLHRGHVWVEVAPPAYGCDNEARGYGKCDSWCGSRDACVHSGD